jgi:hypothetical protein
VSADTFRAICAELLNGLDELAHPRYPFPGYTRCAMDRARTLLAQPEPEGLTDEMILATVRPLYGDQMAADMGAADDLRTIHTFLASRPTPQPQSEWLTVMEIIELHTWLENEWRANNDGEDLPMVDFARAVEATVLARWCRPTPQPVAVSERPWEREGWCDAEGRCWIYMPDIGTSPRWRLTDPRDIGPYHTHSLPANALPTP